MSLSGLDISVYQTTTPPLTGFDFAFARATYATKPDARWAQHSGAILLAGRVLGAYHFGVGASQASIAAQVAAFLATAGHAGLLALDLESNGSGPAMTNAEATDFIGRMHAAGRKVGLYHSASSFPFLGQDFDWIASWGANDGQPHTPPAAYGPSDFWQYTSQGTVPGYSGRLDLDLFNGTLDDLRRLAGMEDDMVITRGKFERWTPTLTNGQSNGVLRAAPDRSSPIVKRLAPGEVLETAGEVVAASQSWRVRYEPDGSVLFALRADWNPQVPGGDPAYNASVFAAMYGTAPTYTTSYNEGVDAAAAAALAAKK